MAEYLFVYGTLLKGEFANYLLKNCILTEYTSIPGTLFDTGYGFPAASSKIKGTSVIWGELYRLPVDKTTLLKTLDSYEDTSNGIFKRISITINGIESFIYVLKEPGIFNQDLIITSGSWLTFSRKIKENPLSFITNFEKSHKFYYRHLSEEKTLLLRGNSGIILSAPHATNHIRLNKYKIFERYTAALSALMHSLTSSTSVYTNSVSISDPNYYDNCDYKTRLGIMCKDTPHHFLLDIHGTGEEREFDIYPGIGRDKEFLLGQTGILDDLYKTARKYNINLGGLDRFPASKQQTVTKYAATQLGIPSMQIEINKRYRLPDKDPERFLVLIEFLRDFLEMIKKRNE